MVIAAFVALALVAAWALATRSGGQSQATGPVFWVAPNGNDSASGSKADPWRTIQNGASTAPPGATVYVRGGVYHELVNVEVSGTAGDGPLTLRNAPGEHPILDGTGLAVPSDFHGLFSIDSRSYVTIQGFEIRNYKTAQPGHSPVGIWVTGASDHIRILDNRVHNIETDVRAGSGGDAHGIAVYGTDPNHPIDPVTISGNEVFDCKLGSSESVVVNGNVAGFAIIRNSVHDNDNIGIDVIGYEGKASDPSVDVARDGVVSDNTIYNIDSYGNPAYGTDRSANGIYVDGGRDVIVERNVIHDVNIGMEFASEHAGRSTSYVTARDNVVYHASVIGLAIGGYDTRRGSTERCLIVNNTFYQNRGVELLIQFNTRDNVIENNIVVANSARHFLENDYLQTFGNVVDHNLYYAPGGGDRGTWQWKGTTYRAFADYVQATGNDRNSVFADPRLADPTAEDFQLGPGSPAIDAGDYLTAAGTIDAMGSPRAAAGVIDLGAFERPAPAPSPTPSLSAPITYVSDMDFVPLTNGWGPVETDMSNGEKKLGDGHALTVGGQTFAKGLGAHAQSVIKVDLGRRCSAFEADVGVDDEVGDAGSVAFQVWGDGEKVYDSGVVRGTQGPIGAYADVTGVQTMKLMVSDGGDGVDNDHADWGNARLACG
jgi:NPCBM/NEW2 domain/Right handed beta helix region